MTSSLTRDMAVRLAFEAGLTVFREAGGEGLWPPQGGGDTPEGVLLGLLPFLERHPGLPPEAVYRQVIASWGVAGDDPEGWHGLPEPERLAYEAFTWIADPLLQRIAAGERRGAVLHIGEARVGPLGRRLRRSGRAGRRSPLVHAGGVVIAGELAVAQLRELRVQPLQTTPEEDRAGAAIAVMAEEQIAAAAREQKGKRR